MIAGNDAAAVFIPLLLTIVIEGAAFFIFGLRRRSFQQTLLLVNCITNPLLTILQQLFALSLPTLLVSEGVIAVAEYLLLAYALGTSSRKLFVLTLLANLASFLAGMAVAASLHPALAVMIGCRVSKEPISCLKQEIVSVSKLHPEQTKALLDDVYALWPVVYQGQDRRQLSDTVHDVGAILAARSTDLDEALGWCSRYWYAGCIHGAVMQAIMDTIAGRESEFLQTCDHLKHADTLLECVHGVGHVVWAKRTQDDLGMVLDRCRRWTDDQFAACISGVLMEYSKDDASGSHEHAAHQAIHARELPCGQLAAEYRQICYGAEASYRVYYPGDSFLEGERYCYRIPREYHRNCRQEIGRRRVLSGLRENE